MTMRVLFKPCATWATGTTPASGGRAAVNQDLDEFDFISVVVVTKAIGPECARPRAQKRPQTVGSRRSSTCWVGSSLLPPRTGALRWCGRDAPRRNRRGCMEWPSFRTTGFIRRAQQFFLVQGSAHRFQEDL